MIRIFCRKRHIADFVRELPRFEKDLVRDRLGFPAEPRHRQGDLADHDGRPDWRVETHYCLVRWDDIIATVARQSGGAASSQSAERLSILLRRRRAVGLYPQQLATYAPFFIIRF